MAGGLIFGHSLCSVGSSFFLLRPLELGFGLGALLRMVGHGFLLEEIATTRRGIFERHRQADKRDPVVIFTRTVLVCTQLIWAKIGKYFYLLPRSRYFRSARCMLSKARAGALKGGASIKGCAGSETTRHLDP